MSEKIHIVIMAGGIGSRLYPLSTPEKPKQFLDLLGTGKTLIQMTYERFLRVDENADFWVVTSGQYAGFVREQLPQLPLSHILCEPEPRSTTPCIAYASWKIAAMSPGERPCIIFTPADAYAPELDKFAATMRSAVKFASSCHSIVCTGICPSRPETGYGYIHASIPENAAPNEVHKVLEFKEKPCVGVAKQYLEDGEYLWNAGIFVWNLETIVSEIRLNAPSTAALMDELSPYLFTQKEDEALARLFPQCEKISIDYAVMEKSDAVYVVPGEWIWSDLGGFEALSAITGKEYDNFSK